MIDIKRRVRGNREPLGIPWVGCMSALSGITAGTITATLRSWQVSTPVRGLT